MVLVLGLLLVALSPLARAAQAHTTPPELQQQQESWRPLVVELEASMQSSVLFELRAAASEIAEGPRPHDDAIAEGPRPHNDAIAEGPRPHDDAIAEGPRPHDMVEGPRPSAEPVRDSSSSSWATPPVPGELLGALPGSVPDSSAVLVGQMFSLRVPPRGGANGSCDLTVTSLGKPRLPSFLSWDGERCVLRGVALDRDRGAHHLSVSTGGVFSLEVYAEDEELPLVAGGGVLSCGEEPLTVLTVILDADLTKMAAAQRVALLRVMAGFASGAAPESLRAAPVVNNRLFDMSAFMAGPGNAKKVVENGALLSWPLGCALDQSTVPDLGAVRVPARDGSMSARLGYPVVGWHVANKKAPPPLSAAGGGGVRRLRRQLYNTPTPVPSLPPPTAAHPEPPPARLVPTPTSPAIAPLSTDSSATPVRGPLPLPVKPTIRLRDQMAGALGPTPALGPPQPTRVLGGGGGTTSTLPIQPTVTRPTIVDATALPTPPSTSTRRPKTTSNTTSTRRPKTTSTRRPTKRPRVKSTTAKPAAPKTTTTLTAPPPPVVAPDNRMPEIRNPIDEVNAWVGTYFEVKIPPDTFYDQEDGTADKLRLTLKKTPREAVGEGSWIHFNSTIQLLYGMPDERDTGKHEYFMLATDKGGRSIMDAFEVRVHRWSGGNDKPSALFAARFHGDHKTLLNDVHKKITLSKKLAYALGDRNASTVSIRSITKGSIVVEWTNNSLTQSVCPKEQITALCNRISDPQGKPKLAFSKAMEPDFKAMNITVLGANLCQRYSFVPPGEVPVGVGAAPPAGGGGAAAGPTPTTFPVHADGRSTDDVYLHTVIPAVVVAALLLVAGVLAMVCYRKKRKGKMTMEEQATFIKKGVPIIFADELDDSKSPPSSSIPLILQEEKPPLPPPEYPNMLLSGGGGHGGGSLMGGHGGSLMGGPGGVCGPLSATLLSADLLEEYSCYHDDLLDDPNAPPYQPPPPFTVPMEHGKGSRPKNMTSYRSPPPYVPP